MFTKIAAGLVAAAVVTGAGVYFAYTGTEAGCQKCPIQRMMEANNSSESSECGENRSCCMPAAPTEPNMALAACAGGTTMESSAKTAAPAPCCAVE